MTPAFAARDRPRPRRADPPARQRGRARPAVARRDCKRAEGAGLFRLCRPRELGGLEADPITVLDVVEEIARHDGSAAWCALNCGIAGVLQAFLSEEGANEIATEPDHVVNGVIAPSGRAIAVDGGYRVTGRWGFVSNCHHCTWIAPSCVVVDPAHPEPQTDPQLVMTWLPATDIHIVDTWDTAGLRATGSHDIEVDDLFVPRLRTIALPLDGPVVDRTLFRFPVVGLWAVGLAAAALGIAKAAIDEVLDLASTKTPFGMSSHLATRASTQISVCHAMATTFSARALLVEESHRLWAMAQAGAPISPPQIARLRIAATHATAASVDAVDRMYTVAGGTAIYSSHPLQRCLRDAHAITQHHFVAPPTYEMLGRIVLDVEPTGFML